MKMMRKRKTIRRIRAVLISWLLTGGTVRTLYAHDWMILIKLHVFPQYG